MSNIVIDSKTESHSFGALFAKEKVKTTISLVKMANAKFGLSYNSEFSGIKDGHVSGGPYEVSGNENLTAHDSPKVMLIISNYTVTAESISMNVEITVDIPVIGSETIYNETLSGTNTSGKPWSSIMEHFSQKAQHAEA